MAFLVGKKTQFSFQLGSYFSYGILRVGTLSLASKIIMELVIYDTSAENKEFATSGDNIKHDRRDCFKDTSCKLPIRTCIIQHFTVHMVFKVST
jgi:hypothetical protein